MPTVRVPAHLFTRRWSCMVVDSGFHNGAHCSPSDPHGDGWDCRFVYSARLTEKQWEEANS